MASKTLCAVPFERHNKPVAPADVVARRRRSVHISVFESTLKIVWLDQRHSTVLGLLLEALVEFVLALLRLSREHSQCQLGDRFLSICH